MTIIDILLCRFFIHRWAKWGGLQGGVHSRQYRHCERCNKVEYRWVK